MGDVTQLLMDWQAGDKSALARLMPIVYGELRRIAARAMRRELVGHTLQPTALVNEAYLRLIRQERADWRNRTHFFAIAAQLMRRILVDHVRGKKRLRRGGEQVLVTLEELGGVASPDTVGEVDVLALDEALNKLERLAPRQCRIVELRFFSGLTVEATAEALGISPVTVKREWAVAKTFLYRELRPTRGG
ncbi:MAG: sigma-70 family RNA polymerase sigma factor [Chloracidobacterium sp.]|nr:sigma-70 family RNA polymerase sigma factor [Chloracidobacterium sp.]MDW8216876.1 sigma-70 family RNA polymerase sigma factor [Acidobacteriota bacterium]